MGRDFRPKGKGGAPRARPKHADTDDEDVPEEELLRQVQALGGDADDVALMRSKGSGTQVNDAQLSSELAEFMKKENMQLPALSAASPNARAQTKPAKAKAAAPDAHTKDAARAEAPKKGAARDERNGDTPKKGAARTRDVKPAAEARPKGDQQRHRDASQAAAPARAAGKHMVFEGDTPRVVTPSSLKLLIEPVSEWTSLPLPTLPAAPAKAPKTVPDATVDALHALGDQVLRDEGETYTRLGNGEGGRNVTLGTLTQSDLQFARTLLTSNKAGTLSDRISAVTLLLQNSPLHNTKALETLMHMAGKPGREEASRATRALADWFASGGGLGPNKLHYFRDQPALRDAAGVYASGTTQALRLCVCVWAYEDLLKKTYFAFVQLLERQSHDTLLFMRKQAVTQIFMLLRDKPEQEHNLLRLLTNKLGDPDRSVASKASTHLMELLHAHPAMKGIVLREVSETVLRSQVVGAEAKDGKARGNQHATYYGVLTLNQTLFTTQDAELANEVFSVYFQLFDVCLAQEAAAEKRGPASDKDGARDKKRWRDKKAPTSREQVNKAASDVDSRLLAAILTGIRRVFPFTTLSSAALDKHLDTLFRITHTHSFNIAIQALQLVFQVAIGTSRDADAPQFSSQVADRYYRTLYDSLLDTRLATTSKQAMYLNLLYKSLKADLDGERVKAFVKRLCQILALQEPPFICGALVLLSQLFAASPGLRAMLTEPEEEGVEHFADQTEEAAPSAKPAQATSLYDGRKRDPRFARAGDTALWDILPLVRHFHPSVSLNAKQLIAGEKVTSNPDLTLNTLMHFLDRFVFRNPKKVSAVKGSSIMQPALSGDLDADVVVRRSQVPLDYVNSAAFWNQRPENVPADQQFFLQYFQTKQKRAGQAPAPADAHDEAGSADDVSDAELSTDDEEEKEIWKAMKRSIPQEREDDVDIDDDDDMLEALEGDEDDEGDEDEGEEGAEQEGEDEEEDEEAEEEAEAEVEDEEEDEEDQAHLAGSDSDDEPAMFLEDEDDLVPFARFEDDSDEETATAGKKRPAEDTDAAPTSKNRKRTEQRRKRREAPAFASAEDYAHMLASDDEGNL